MSLKGWTHIQSDQGTMLRVLVVLSTAGPALGLLWLALPHGEGANETAILATALAGFMFSGLALVGPERMPSWVFPASAVCGTALITTAIYFTGAASTAYAMFYVWAAVYVFYFFSVKQAVAQMVAIGAGYAIALAALDGSESTPVARWVLTVGTITVVGVLIHALRRRTKSLIVSLAEAARTDVLTGLLNRRGFQELFEVEVERARRANRHLSLLVADLDRFKEVNDRYGHRAGDQVLEHVGDILSAAARRVDTVARIGGEEFAVIAPETDMQGAYTLAERLRQALQDAFAEQPIPLTASIGIASFPEQQTTAEGLLSAADQALYAAKGLGRNRSLVHSAAALATLVRSATRRAADEGHLAAMLAIAETLDFRDAGTAEHSKTVSQYSEQIARELGLSGNIIDDVRVAALLHDVGKVGVPDAILRKAGPLTNEEWMVMKNHPGIGALILESAELSDVHSWVRAHHERPDGTGYPEGLPGEEIPLQARILAVADAYETMTTDRIYRPAIGPERACQELRRCAGTQFDERVVEAFLAVLERERVAA